MVGIWQKMCIVDFSDVFYFSHLFIYLKRFNKKWNALQVFLAFFLYLFLSEEQFCITKYYLHLQIINEFINKHLNFFIFFYFFKPFNFFLFLKHGNTEMLRTDTKSTPLYRTIPHDAVLQWRGVTRSYSSFVSK